MTTATADTSASAAAVAAANTTTPVAGGGGCAAACTATTTTNAPSYNFCSVVYIAILPRFTKNTYLKQSRIKIPPDCRQFQKVGILRNLWEPVGILFFLRILVCWCQGHAATLSTTVLDLQLKIQHGCCAALKMPGVSMNGPFFTLSSNACVFLHGKLRLIMDTHKEMKI